MPGFKLYDLHGNEVSQDDREKRAEWYVLGQSRERVFVDKWGTWLGVMINPAKAHDPTVPDLMTNGTLGDLKCQDKPLFMAQQRYGSEPLYTVTFNLKDAYHYGPFGKNYPNLVIYYWVNWLTVKMVMQDSGEIYRVLPLHGLWRVPFAVLDQQRRSQPIHWYVQRGYHYEDNEIERQRLIDFEPRLQDGPYVRALLGQGDNAACSYLFDLRLFEQVW
jgi:hypothetical protein